MRSRNKCKASSRSSRNSTSSIVNEREKKEEDTSGTVGVVLFGLEAAVLQRRGACSLVPVCGGISCLVTVLFTWVE